MSAEQFELTLNWGRTMNGIDCTFVLKRRAPIASVETGVLAAAFLQLSEADYCHLAGFSLRWGQHVCELTVGRIAGREAARLLRSGLEKVLASLAEGEQ